MWPTEGGDKNRYGGKGERRRLGAGGSRQEMVGIIRSFNM
ncbi:unnamed protein product [Spirodela intermedia]|uniref:Uncharacterized protein n=1 Tax=Spirodela intermedia TaxID=51605 RepID=A0A7I8IGG6_SPIIN|nr:unnamed protein product [Spirodela intermedia]CAA6656980.1 unnamed protein product [Spirodela intermedia]